mmetsp:Transcript_12370/g.13694  ORF Transcript_12370/g.13694 Transcript_12370/m.13694 type:complete len:874 (-) Transcript_12370:513-3134(-)
MQGEIVSEDIRIIQSAFRRYYAHDEFLSLRRKKASRVKLAKELLHTEGTYLKYLNQTTEYFQKPITDAAEFKPEELRQIFGGIEEIQRLSKVIHDALDKRLQEWNNLDTKDQRLGDVFQVLIPFLKLYTIYCTNYYNGVQILSEKKEKSKSFCEFITDLLDKVPNDYDKSQSLESLLIMPIQRMCRYELLFRELVKNTNKEHVDYKPLVDAHESVQGVNSHLEKHLAQFNNWQKMLEIEKTLKNKPASWEMLKPGRLFILEGQLTKKCRKEDKERYFFLFSDVIIYCKKYSGGKKLAAGIAGGAEFAFHKVLELKGASLEDKKDDASYKNQFAIITSKKSFVVYTDTVKEKEKWVKAINEALVESRAGVAAAHASVWVQDNDAPLCMVCEAKFTTFFRRHHCRSCGKVVCETCSKYRAHLPHISEGKVRICLLCNLAKFGGNEIQDPKAKRRSGIFSKAKNLNSPTMKLKMEEKKRIEEKKRKEEKKKEQEKKDQKRLDAVKRLSTDAIVIAKTNQKRTKRKQPATISGSSRKKDRKRFTAFPRGNHSKSSENIHVRKNKRDRSDMRNTIHIERESKGPGRRKTVASDNRRATIDPGSSSANRRNSTWQRANTSVAHKKKSVSMRPTPPSAKKGPRRSHFAEPRVRKTFDESDNTIAKPPKPKKPEPKTPRKRSNKNLRRRSAAKKSTSLRKKPKGGKKVPPRGGPKKRASLKRLKSPPPNRPTPPPPRSGRVPSPSSKKRTVPGTAKKKRRSQSPRKRPTPKKEEADAKTYNGGTKTNDQWRQEQNPRGEGTVIGGYRTRLRKSRGTGGSRSLRKTKGDIPTPSSESSDSDSSNKSATPPGSPKKTRRVTTRSASANVLRNSKRRKVIRCAR